MLFNSYEFIIFFVPIVLLGFYFFGNRGREQLAICWLVFASLFFYGWWNPVYLALIVASILFNYTIGAAIAANKFNKGRALLIVGVVVNLGLLGYFKYMNFFVDNINAVIDTDLFLAPIVLPLAISFFTFQQISYLADARLGIAKEYNFLHYCLFVTFFPQLIAGPIVHHGEMLPQFEKKSLYKFNPENLSIGITIFIMGLFKKVVLADGIAVYASPVFDAAETGIPLTFVEAWGGILAYTFQIYFDFSGYSDMAIGLARMFGILLPLNFNSPYKATSIVDFWRRWHMTLSRFLRDYVYIPLGGNRRGRYRRYANLMAVMVVGGLWHGAGWTFVIWGTLHGSYLIVNHLWMKIRSSIVDERITHSLPWTMLARTITLLAVIVAWVFFRAESADGALNMLRGMFGKNGISIPERYLDRLNQVAGLGDQLASMGVKFVETPYFIGLEIGSYMLLLLAVCWLLPNTQQIMMNYRPAIFTRDSEACPSYLGWMQWRPHSAIAVMMAGVAIYSLSSMTGVSEFLYFQF